MNRIDLLAATFACACGKQHSVPTREFIYNRDALDALPQTAQAIDESGNWLIIADARTFEAAGQFIAEKLRGQGYTPQIFIVPDVDGESPVADDRTRDFLLQQAPEASLYIAVGSGVINDLVKWVSFLRKRPYITVATAPSMNGYGSANVAATIDGLKVLFHAEAPLAVFSTPQILAEAPFELTTSGLGDVLAKPVSSADWKLNQLLFSDYYCQFSVDLLKELEPVYLDNPDGIQAKEPEAIKALFEALFYSSVAMTITETSSPASGGEHLLSHTLDMLAGRDSLHHDFHGRQVGVCSILMAALYAEILKIDRPQFCEPPPQVATDFWLSLTSVVAPEYEKKLHKYKVAREFFAKTENWNTFRKLISPGLVTPARLKNCLARAGGAHRICDIRDNGNPLSRTKFMKVALYANQMRARFTVLDICVLLGIIPHRLEQLVDTWLVD